MTSIGINELKEKPTGNEIKAYRAQRKEVKRRVVVLQHLDVVLMLAKMQRDVLMEEQE